MRLTLGAVVRISLNAPSLIPLPVLPE
jgi:hypothetical protein